MLNENAAAKLTTLLLLLSSTLCPAQQTDTIINSDAWKTVIVTELDFSSDTFQLPFPDSCSGGEYAIKTKKYVKSMKGISESELKEIKQFVANRHGCIAYLDTKHQTLVGANEVYFLWSKCLSEEIKMKPTRHYCSWKKVR